MASSLVVRAHGVLRPLEFKSKFASVVPPDGTSKVKLVFVLNCIGTTSLASTSSRSRLFGSSRVCRVPIRTMCVPTTAPLSCLMVSSS